MKKNNLKAAVNFVESIFFPQSCIFCGELIEADEFVCDNCRDNLPVIEGEICNKCGREKEKCECSKSSENFYDGIIAPFYFEGGVRSAIFRFKFSGEKSVVEPLADYMSECFTKRYRDITFDYVSYVPMDMKRQKNRGYNQSRLLAQRLSAKLGITFADEMLVKICNTDIQHDLHYIERSGNIFGAFDVNVSFNLKGKTVLLIDDIKTTGNTLDECAKMLKLYGADRVFCLTAAVVNSKIKK